MKRSSLAVLLSVLVAAVLAAGYLGFRDKPALVYRYHTDGWGEPEGHTVTLMRSGATVVELERTETAPALSIPGQVPPRQLRDLLAALDAAGFYEVAGACRKHGIAGAPTRSLTLYRDGKALTGHDFWSCARDADALQALLTVLDDFAIGKREGLELGPPRGAASEDALGEDLARELAGGRGLIHLNLFGEGRLDREFVISLALTRTGLAQVAFRRLCARTQRSFVEIRTVRLPQGDLASLGAKVDRLSALDLPRCVGAGRYFHLSWPRARGRGELSVVEGCAAPEIAREITGDLVTLGERIARGPPSKIVSR